MGGRSNERSANAGLECRIFGTTGDPVGSRRRKTDSKGSDPLASCGFRNAPQAVLRDRCLRPLGHLSLPENREATARTRLSRLSLLRGERTRAAPVRSLSGTRLRSGPDGKIVLRPPSARGFCPAQFRKASSAGQSACPHSVSRYSTRGGTSGWIVRATRPSASSPRSCWASIFCEMPGMSRSRSE